MTLIVHTARDRERPLWVTAITPTADELERLRAEFGFSAELIDHALDPNERARVRTLSGTTFMVLRIPWFEGDKAPVPYTTVPVALHLGGPTGLTLSGCDSPIVRELARTIDAKANEPLLPLVVLRLLELSAEAYLDKLEQINAAVDTLEERLQRSLENREVLDLLRYQKSLVYFTTALDAMTLMSERIEKLPELALSPKDKLWLEDVRIELHQAFDTSMTSRNVMSEMMDAFASIISNNLNVVMKFLAGMTVILTLPSTIASFYGMNVHLPGADHPAAFLAIVLASSTVSILLVVYFRRRGWI